MTCEQWELCRRFAERRRSLKAGAWALAWFGVLTHGIESVSLEGRELHYCNTGETYGPTIAREGREYLATSWGDWYEAAEQEFNEENDTIRCAWCGAFTDFDGQYTVCGNCGELASGG